MGGLVFVGHSLMNDCRDDIALMIVLGLVAVPPATTTAPVAVLSCDRLLYGAIGMLDFDHGLGVTIHRVDSAVFDSAIRSCHRCLAKRLWTKKKKLVQIRKKKILRL